MDANTTELLWSSPVSETTTIWNHSSRTTVTFESVQNQSIPFYAHSVVVPVVWAFLALVGTVGNGLVIFTMLKQGGRTATTYYIINLAIADLAFIVIVVPFTTTLYALPDWIFGEQMCRFTSYMVYVTLYATCLTLTAMTIDRYFAIVHPLSSMARRTLKVPLVTSVCTWAASFLLCIPFALYHATVTDNWFGPRIWCREVWPSRTWSRGAVLYVVIATYIIPLTIIILCYSLMLKDMWKQPEIQVGAEGSSSNRASLILRSTQAKRRRKVAKMVAVVVILFATFWLPIHVLNVCFAFLPKFPPTDALMGFKIFAHTLSYANSCVNPFVYAIMGDAFRRALRKTFSRLCRLHRVIGITTEGRQTMTSEGALLSEQRATRALLGDATANTSSRRRSSEPFMKPGSLCNSAEQLPCLPGAVAQSSL